MYLYVNRPTFTNTRVNIHSHLQCNVLVARFASDYRAHHCILHVKHITKSTSKLWVHEQVDEEVGFVVDVDEVVEIPGQDTTAQHNNE